MKQLAFDCEADDKFTELKNFIWEVNDIFEFNNTPQTEKAEIIKNG